MFWKPKQARDWQEQFTPLQAHFLVQFARSQVLLRMTETQGDESMRRMVERIAFSRYLDCAEQGLAEGARSVTQYINNEIQGENSP